MNWHNLYFGHVSPQEVQEAVRDEEWQALRRSIKGKSLQDKFCVLCDYFNLAHYKHMKGIISDREMRMVEVRLTNYVTALSRGGLIKPEDYR